MKRSNELLQTLVKAEVNKVNIDIMSKNPNKLPDDISHEFLHLQKELISEDLRKKISEKQSAKEKKTRKESNHEPATSSMPPSKQEIMLDGEPSSMGEAC